MLKFVVLLSAIACALGAAIPDEGLLPQLDGRIVGGSAASIANFPWQISLQRSGSHSCGGSIYSPSIIITAAHCLQGGVAASILSVRAGSNNWKSGGSSVKVSKYTNHPNYSSSTMSYDIAVIKLASALTLGSNIKAIALATSTPANGAAAKVSGWGTQSSGSSSIPDTLLYVDLKIVNAANCRSSYGSAAITGTMLCAAAAGKDACQGDSGGPLVSGSNLVGVVSWGYGCADAKYPGVYADVPALRSWVVGEAGKI